MEVGAYVASTFEKMKWNAHGKGMTYRAFHFTGHSDLGYMVVLSRGANYLHIGHLVPLERANFTYVARC